MLIRSIPPSLLLLTNTRAAWHSFQLDEVEYRRGGHELVPFDIIWEGWLSEDALPAEGSLRLEVLPLHDHECGWLRDSRIDAVRELEALRVKNGTVVVTTTPR